MYIYIYICTYIFDNHIAIVSHQGSSYYYVITINIFHVFQNISLNSKMIMMLIPGSIYKKKIIAKKR